MVQSRGSHCCSAYMQIAPVSHQIHLTRCWQSTWDNSDPLVSCFCDLTALPVGLLMGGPPALRVPRPVPCHSLCLPLPGDTRMRGVP